MKVKFVFPCIIFLVIEASLVYGSKASWDAAVAADNPLHWYRFDEMSGTSCLDYGSVALNGAYNAVVLAQDGLLGSATAVEFLGSSLVNFGSAPPIFSDWTAEYIVMRKGNTSQALHDDGISSLRVQGWSMQEASFTLYGVADYQFTKQPGQEPRVPLNEWRHLVFRRNHLGTQLFIDGVLVGTHTSSVNMPLAALGGRANTSSDAFYGLLDEAVVYDRALSDEQIRIHSEACKGTYTALVPDDFDDYADTSDLLAYWTSTGQLFLETDDTYQGSAGAMRAVLPAPGAVIRDVGEVFDYSLQNGHDLIVRIKGDQDNVPGDITLLVLDRDDTIVESFTWPGAATRTEWTTLGVPVDTASKPGWGHIGKIRVEVSAAATVLVDELTFQNRAQRIAGDLNGDGHVDLADLVLFAGQWLNAACFGPDCADLNRTDGVNMADLALLSDNWKARFDSVRINEFMAVNSYVPFLNPTDIHTTVNGIAEHSDWIELHNASMENGISLEGWYLTDDRENLTKWKFPPVFIPADGYLAVYASGKTAEEYPGNFPYIDDEGNLHTNFELSGDGEYLALVWNDGATVVCQYAPEFPPQRGLVSYGLDSNGLHGYLKTPTPRAPNSAVWTGAVADTKFSIDRGLFETGQSFDVQIACETEGSLIRYTLDGSTPTLSKGYVYTTPISIASTTCLRAAAFKDGWLPSNVDTHTYLFLDDVIRQSPNGETPVGWPAGSVNGQVFEYGMDPDIADSEEYGPLILEAMAAIPSLSLVTDLKYLVDPAIGIYVNASREGVQWERPTSVELLNANHGENFQMDAGLRIRGGYSRGGSNPKHSFRLMFKGGYGRGKLKYPLFDDERGDEFDNLDLRTAQNYAWSNWGNDGSRNTFLRDVYSRDLQREMGQPYTASRYYHLYINGQYWGLYQSQERSEASYAEHYFGDDKPKYDVVKADDYRTGYTDGTLDKWNELWSLCEAGFDTDAAYYAVQGKNPLGQEDPDMEVHVDVDNLMDYMIGIFFTGNRDAPVTLSQTAANNFFAIRNRDPRRRQGWQFFAYDSEHSMLSVGDNRTTWVSAGSSIEHFNPQWLHQKLAVHPEYRLRFADQVHKHFFNEGVLTPDHAKALCLRRAAEIDLAIIGESARWGDHRSDRVNSPYTRAHWWAEVKDYLVDTFLAARTEIVLDQLKAAQLYPP
ncbi:MAG: CotH kinase family protein, partial [Sedimentisphaerales bacterium]|nr:CotH kinase family protein [Sedimentisphaerales bacterium]